MFVDRSPYLVIGCVAVTLLSNSAASAQGCNSQTLTNVLRSSASMQAFDLNPPGAGHLTALDPIPWDFDSDGDDDLVITSSSQNIVLLRNEGAGTGQFTDVTSLAFPPTAFNGLGRPIVQAGATGDLNSDGRPDLVIGTNLAPVPGSGVWILEGRVGTGPIGTTTLTLVDENGQPANQPWQGGAAPFTGLVLADVTTDTPIPVAVPPGLRFDLDGRLDIIATRGVSGVNWVTPPFENAPGALLIAAGTASGPYLDVSPALPPSQAPPTPNWLPLPDSNWSDPTVADFDGDGRLDTWVSGSDGVLGFEIYGYDYVWRSNATGTVGTDRFSLQPAALVASGTYQSGFDKVALDYDQDGDLDVVSNFSGSITVKLNQSTPGMVAFGPPLQAAVLSCRDSLVSHSSLVLGDFNQDGLQDVVEVNGTFLAGVPGGLVQVSDGMDVELGAGTLGGGFPAHGAATDFDNDGDLDIVYASGGDLRAFVDWDNLLDGPQVATPVGGGNRSAVYAWSSILPGYALVDVQEATPHYPFPIAPTVGLVAVFNPVIVWEPTSTYTLTLPDYGGTIPVFVQFWDVFNGTPQVTNVVRTLF